MKTERQWGWGGGGPSDGGRDAGKEGEGGGSCAINTIVNAAVEKTSVKFL